MWETGPDGTERLTRTWIIFFEQLGKLSGQTDTKTGRGTIPGPYIRTLLLKNTTVGNDVADHVPIYQAGSVIRVIGVLRRMVATDLTVRIKLNGKNLVTMTIPHTTLVDSPVITLPPTPEALADVAVLSWDVVASDGTIDAAGVASFTIEWQ